MMGENLSAGFKFFSEVPPNTLEAIGKKGKMLEFGPDDIVFHFDEPAEHLYGLVDGMEFVKSKTEIWRGLSYESGLF